MAVELAQALIHEVVVDDSKAVAGAQNVSRAMESMAASSDKATASATKQASGLRLLDEAAVKLTRAQESAWGALQKWKGQADDNERAMQRLAKAEADLERAVRQGVASEEEKIRVLDQLRQKLAGAAAANDNLARSMQVFDTMKGRLDSTAAAYASLNREAEALDALLSAGRITVQDHVQWMGKLAAEIDKVSGKTASLAAIEAERARQQAQDAQRRFNGVLGVQERPVTGSAAASASVFEETARAADREAKALADLQARARALTETINPAARAQRQFAESMAEADDLLARGLISYEQHAIAAKHHHDAMRIATGAMDSQEVAVKKLTNALGLTKAQMAQLSPQINDVISGLIMGQPPMMIFAQQSGQIVQALQAGGAEMPKFSAKTLAMVGGVATLAVAFGVAVAAAAKFTGQSREIANANTFMGGAIGRSSDQLLALAERAADAGRISVASAREQEAAYIRTGKIGAQSMEVLIALSRDYAAAVRKDVTDAQKDLADLFSDPVAGAKKLSDAYGLLSGQQLEHIRQLKATGQEEQARLVLADALTTRTRGLGDQVGTLAQAWERVARAASNAFNAVGQAVAPETNAQAIARLEERRRQLIAARGLDAGRLDGETGGAAVPEGAVPVDSRYSAPGMATANGELATVDASLAQRYAQRARDREMAARVGDWQDQVKNSAAADAATRSTRPMVTEIASLTESITTLESGLKNPGLMAFADDAGRALEGLKNKRADYEAATAKGLDIETDKRQRLAAVEQKYAGLVGPAHEARKAAEIERINLLGTATTAEERKLAVGAAVTQVTAGQTQALAQMSVSLTSAANAARLNAEAAGQGEAAMRRAAIEAEVYAHRMDGTAAAVRASLEEQEKYARSQIHNEFARGIDQEVAANERLVVAMGKGLSAWRDAEIYNAAYLQTLKETTPAEANWGEKLQANIDLLNRKAKAADNKAFADYGQQLEDQTRQLQLQAKLIGATPEQAARLQVEYDINKLLIDRKTTYDQLSAVEKQQIDDLREKALQVADFNVTITRQKAAWEELSNSLGRSFDRLGDSLSQVFVEGNAKAVNWGNVTKAIIASLVTDLLKMAAINPLRNAVFGGSSPSLWDLGASAANQNAANQNGMGGTLGPTGNLLSTGQSLYSAATGSTASTMAGAGTWLAETSVGHSMGLSTAYPLMSGGGAAPVTQVGTLYAQNSAGASLSSGLGAIGSAAPWGFLGGMAGSHIGNAAGGNKAIGGLSGAALGVGSYAAGTAAMGAMGMGAAASAAGASGVAGATAALSAIPVYGWIAAAAIAAITAIMGTQKPTVGPNAGANIDRQADGTFRRTSSGADNGANTQYVDQVTDAVSQMMNSLVASGAKTDASHWLYMAGGDKVKVNGRKPQTAEEFIKEVLGTFSGEGLVGRALDVAKGQSAVDVEGLIEATAIAKNVDDGTTALQELDKSLHAVQVSALKATAQSLQPMVDELETASKYGFSDEYRNLVTGQLTNVLDDIANPKVWTQTQTAVASFQGQMAALRQVAEKVNPALAETVNKIEKAGLEDIYKGVRTTYAANLNSALGMDYRNSLQGVRDYWNANATDMVLAGKDPNALYKAQAQQIIDGLTDSQIDDVVSYFRDLDPVMASLADSLRGTTTAAKEAAKAQEDALRQNAASLREYLDALGLSDLSNLSPEQQYAEAQRQYGAALAGTDVSAATKANDALLRAARTMFGTTAEYGAGADWSKSSLTEWGKRNGLPMFAAGGITDGPSIAGEGIYREAVVPLPDGRTIPARITGGGNKDMVAKLEEVRRELVASRQINTRMQEVTVGALALIQQAIEASTDAQTKAALQAKLAALLADQKSEAA